ncbi:MAG: sulfotransferase family 2 domain-containing protein [Pseudomonadota bacterium]
MIYSPERGYLFIHIPKTGGTSLALALEARAKPGDVMAGDTPKAVKRRRRLKTLPARGRLWKHSTLRDLDGWLSPADLERLYIFTIVRNPWDRLVSYYHWLRVQSFDHPAVGLARDLSFAEFVAHPHTEASFKAATYASYVTDIQGRERCQRFLRMENLAADSAALGADLGIRLDLSHVNRSERGADYRDYFPESARQPVEKLVSEDAERFGYAFDGEF